MDIQTIKAFLATYVDMNEAIISEKNLLSRDIEFFASNIYFYSSIRILKKLNEDIYIHI